MMSRAGGGWRRRQVPEWKGRQRQRGGDGSGAGAPRRPSAAARHG